LIYEDKIYKNLLKHDRGNKENLLVTWLTLVVE